MTDRNHDSITFHDVVEEKDEARREELIGQLVARMTLDEKLSQMGGAAKLPELVNYGSAVFRAGGCERLGIPQVKFSDGPRGVMLNKSTCFPVSMCRGATWDVELEERVGSAIGTEGRAQGANLLGSVCINLLRHPAWGRAQETYGEDTFHLGEMGAAQARGLQNHVMACVKHFAVNSIENSRFWVDVRVDDRTLMEIYLPHFRKCLDAGTACVMGAYNRMNGPHCCHNRRLLTEILKEEWGFDGFVISDWTFALRGSDAAAAGLDIEMPNAVFFGGPLERKVKSGKIPEGVIDEAVTRIIRQHARFQHIGNDDYGREKVACAEHAGLALEVARKGIVLLKNESTLLPLDREKTGSIAVIGELADTGNIGDRGSSNLRPPYVVSPLEGIRNKAGKPCGITFEDGGNISKVKKAARGADAVIVVAGLTSDDEGEFIPFLTKGGDRTRLGLPAKQVRMIKAAAAANENCIVVLEGGSAITMHEWIDDVPALLMAWYPGMEGGNAIAEILFGDVNPGGRLPVTFPRSGDQLVPFSKWARKIAYGYYHGYRHFDHEGHEPLFPFGYGLSYTEFEYSRLKIDPEKAGAGEKITIAAKIKNTGERAGDEVVQVYIGCDESKVERAPKELRAFRRISLEPGESRTAEFEIDTGELAYYDAGAKEWKVERTGYTVYVGSSSRESDLHLSGTFVVE